MLLALFACTAASTSPEDILPTEEQLHINLPADDAAAKSLGDDADGFARFYVVTRDVTENVNGMISFVLGTVRLITAFPPTTVDEAGTEATWGPYRDSGLDPVSSVLNVRREDDGSYTWAFSWIPAGETEAVDIAGGTVDAGSTRTEASGQFAVDFDTASSMDPAVHVVGRFAVDYAYDADGVAAVAAFDDYGWENGRIVDAAYAYDEDWAGAGEMDLAWLEDIDLRGTDELLTMKSRWQADGQGRADATISGGDLSGSVQANQCWGAGFSEVYYADSAGISEDAGAESACAFTPASYASEAEFSVE